MAIDTFQISWFCTWPQAHLSSRLGHEAHKGVATAIVTTGNLLASACVGCVTQKFLGYLTSAEVPDLPPQAAAILRSNPQFDGAALQGFVDTALQLQEQVLQSGNLAAASDPGAAAAIDAVYTAAQQLGTALQKVCTLFQFSAPFCTVGLCQSSSYMRCVWDYCSAAVRWRLGCKYQLT